MTDRAAHRAEPRMIYRWFSVDGWATRIEFRDRDQRVYLMIATRTDGLLVYRSPRLRISSVQPLHQPMALISAPRSSSVSVSRSFQ
jgi:hypothetical protein